MELLCNSLWVCRGPVLDATFPVTRLERELSLVAHSLRRRYPTKDDLIQLHIVVDSEHESADWHSCHARRVASKQRQVEETTSRTSTQTTLR